LRIKQTKRYSLVGANKSESIKLKVEVEVEVELEKDLPKTYK
jgi:hypothetical protein